MFWLSKGFADMRRRITTIAVVVTCGLAASACGGVATKSDERTEACTDVVKIGAPHPLTGPFAEFGQNAVNGMQIAAQEINDAGGIKALDGAEIEVVPGDTGNDPSQAGSITTKLIESDGVVALVGSYVSSLTLTASTAAEKAGIPMVSQSFVDDLTKRDYQYYFQPPPLSSAVGEAAATGILEASAAAGTPLKRAAIVASADAASIAQMKAASATAEEAGMEVGEMLTFTPGMSDASSIATGILDQKPDVVFLGAAVSDLSLILKATRARGLDVPFVGTGGAYVSPGIVDALDGKTDGLTAAAAWHDDLALPGVAEASRAYRAKFDAPFMPMEAGESWVDVHLLAAAFEGTASCDPEQVREYLAETEFSEGPQSAMPGGKIKFAENGLNEYAEPIVVQWQDGELVTVYPEKYATAEFSAGKK